MSILFCGVLFGVQVMSGNQYREKMNKLIHLIIKQKMDIMNAYKRLGKKDLPLKLDDTSPIGIYCVMVDEPGKM